MGKGLVFLTGISKIIKTFLNYEGEYAIIILYGILFIPDFFLNIFFGLKLY